MTSVFADTYYWLALINPRDAAHHEAVALSQSLTQPLVTTAWVLTELDDAMCQPVNRPTFVKLLQDIAADPETAGDSILGQAVPSLGVLATKKTRRLP